MYKYLIHSYNHVPYATGIDLRGIMSGSRHWWERPVRVLQFNIEDRYGRYLPSITGRELVELARDLHANVLVIFARDPWGRIFYRGGSVGPEHPKMKGDIVREAVEAGREYGIRVVVMVGHTADKHLYHQHSDWAQVNRDGEPILLEHVPYMAEHYEPEWPQLCINSPFYDHIKEEIREAHGLGVDGVFLDSFRYQPDIERACYCQYCQRRFREEHGYDMPREPDWTNSRWRELWEWRYRVVVEKIRGLYEESKRIAPDRVFMYNSHPGGWAGRTSRVVEMARDSIDVVFAECSEVDHQPPGFIAEMTRLTRAVFGGKPVWSSRNYFHLYRTVSSTTPLAIRQGLRESIIAGGSPWLLVFSISYRQDPGMLRAAETVFREHEILEEYLDGAEPLYHAGIIVSHYTRDYYGREHPERYVDGFRGIYYALTHSHIPVEFISERDAEDPESLSRFKVVFAETMVCMKRGIAESLEKYVEDGGGLYVSYLTGTRDEYCIRRYDYPFPGIVGGRLIGVLRRPWSYIVLSASRHPLLRGVKKLLLWGDMSYEFRVSRVTPNMGYHAILEHTHGNILGWVAISSTDWGHEYTLGRSPPAVGARTNIPAIITSEHGEGRTVYISGQLGRHYWRTGLPEYMKLIANTAEYLGGTPPVVLEAPETIEAGYMRQGERLLIHLLNHTYNQRIMAMGTGRIKQPLPPYSSTEAVHPPRTIIPVGGITLKIRDPEDKYHKAFNPLTGRKYSLEANNPWKTIKNITIREYTPIIIE